MPGWLIGLMLLLLPLPAAAQENLSWVDGKQPVYVLPDTSSPILIWLESLPVKLSGRDMGAQWLQIDLVGGSTGWMQQATVKLGMDPLLLPVIEVTPDQVLDGVLYWNVTPFARDVFNLGQRLGNQANFFSKIGDSITVNHSFLHPFGEGRYDLGAYTHLQPVLDYFGGRADNPFSRNSLAAGVGWRAADLLQVGNNVACDPRESPLACEYRTARPAIALIMIGTNDVVMTTPERYFDQLSQITDQTLKAGIIPVLSTLPPQPQFDDRIRAFNRVIVQVAAANRVPLWNYWLAIRDLPDNGLAEDGVHPSLPNNLLDAGRFTPEYLQYGATWRNLTALQLLQKLMLEVIQPLG